MSSLAALFVALLISMSATVAIGQSSVKNIVAVRAESELSIDGKLDEPAWQSAIRVSDFSQFDPEEGAEPTERTSVRVLFDDKALYFGVQCYDDEPALMERQLTRRDRTSQSDRFSVIIDSYHDHSTAFLFSGSVSGVVADGVLSQDGTVYDVAWDAVWDFTSSVNDSGWVGEFKIPFSALRFGKQTAGYVWGINFRRYIARKHETAEWVMVRRSEASPMTISSVSKMGHLVGIKDIEPPLHIDILPYVVSKQSFLSKPEPFPLQSRFNANAGLDLKIGLGNSFTLDAAFNPDFGQVEVDQAVLNLTVFETFYQEKRPFFLEGAQLFSFGNMFDGRSLRLFYSRRIGKKPLAPYGTPAAGYFFADEPQTTTLLGAMKVSGRTQGGLSVGTLTAATNQEEGIEEDINGNQLSPVIFEQQSLYQVVRVKQDFEDNSSIGMMATGSFRQPYHPSLAGGVDWNLRLDDGLYAVDGYVAGSSTHTGINQTLTGTAGRLGVGKIQAEHWLVYSFYDFSTTNFVVDDIGFYSQPREHGGFTQLSYKEDHSDGFFLRYSNSFQLTYRWDWDGALTLGQFEVEPTVVFRNFWSLSLDYIRQLPAYDDINKGIAGLYRRPGGDDVFLTLQSDVRQPVMLAMHTGYFNRTKGENTTYTIAQLTIRPTTWMELIPAFTFYQVRDEEAWVIPLFTDNGKNLFASRDVDQRDMSLRGIIMFSPSLSVQFFTQVLLAKVHYDSFRELATPDDLPSYNYEGSTNYYNPDFNIQALNANIVLRWEYLPGSTMYLVWTQAREGYRGIYSTSYGQDFGETFRLPMDNVLLLKLSYLWGL